MNHTEQTITVPNNDNDVHIQMPGGKVLTIQFRPSNADTNYNGSLDIILPEDAAVTSWKGDDMEDAPAIGEHPHIRLSKQLVTELPWNPDTDTSVPVLWVRFGDGDEYNAYDGMAELADELGSRGIQKLEHRQGGFNAPGYTGNNYISCYWGPEERPDLTNEISEDEFDDLMRLISPGEQVIRFTKDSEIEVIENYDEDEDDVETSNQAFREGETVEVDVLRYGYQTSSFQFGDGSCAYNVDNDCFEIVDE